MKHHLGVFGLLLLGGCAVAPRFDPELACHLPSANEPGALALFKAESETAAGTAFLGGNKVTLLENGPTAYRVMLAAIRGARQRVDMESYEFDGQAAAEFAALLIQKAGEGVQVRLLYDAFGSREQPASLFTAMKQAGVQVVEYSPFDPAKLKTLDLNKRDHRKLLVVDGQFVVTGGINIAQFYLHNTTPPPGAGPAGTLPWRDTDISISGPVAADFERMFAQSWTEQGGKALPPLAAMPAAKGDTIVQAIDGSPRDDHPAIYDSLLTAIATARHSIHLTTGFFVPPPPLLEALECAARRGVDVRLILPSHSTSDTALAGGRADYGDLLKAGVKIYEREGVVLHAKTAVIDGLWSIVGSSNLDWRSTVSNNEIDAVVIGRPFAAQMEAMFTQDEAASRLVTLQGWRHRGLWERLREIKAQAVQMFL
nr:phospholipase D-like domain-containing protein [uncultured Acidocella sp.]